MALPKKISPDNIKESIVEVKYSSDYPFELLLGMYFNVLRGTFKYTNRPLNQSNIVQVPGGNQGQEIKIKIGNNSFFYNNLISLQLSPNTFVFTCLNHYIGWDIYQPEIEKALSLLNNSGYIKSWNRVGIRYISEYPGKELKECINFQFSFGLPQITSDTTALRSEFIYNDSKIILNLSNKVPVIKEVFSNKPPEVIQSSIIDIDVINDNINVSDLSTLMELIGKKHIKEKEIFFGMINEQFLVTLKPEY